MNFGSQWPVPGFSRNIPHAFPRPGFAAGLPPAQPTKPQHQFSTAPPRSLPHFVSSGGGNTSAPSAKRIRRAHPARAIGTVLWGASQLLQIIQKSQFVPQTSNGTAAPWQQKNEEFPIFRFGSPRGTVSRPRNRSQSPRQPRAGPQHPYSNPTQATDTELGPSWA